MLIIEFLGIISWLSSSKVKSWDRNEYLFLKESLLQKLRQFSTNLKAHSALVLIIKSVNKLKFLKSRKEQAN